MSLTPRRRAEWLAILVVAGGLFAARASTLDDIGVTELRALHPELDGSGVTVAQPEAMVGAAYQVDPAATGLDPAKFSYYDSTHLYPGGGGAFNPSLASGHANLVGQNFFGVTTGVAPGVTAIESFEAGYFFNDVVAETTTTWNPVPIASRVVNQSFIFTTTDPSTIAMVNRYYDAYANQFGTLFVNGTSNLGGLTPAPASAYNGISVDILDGPHAGKALIVAPAGATSFATPYVAGAAAVLIQAGDLGHAQALAGTDPTDSRVIKAVLLDGATKTSSWSQTQSNPLDETFGAGVVNVNTSHTILSGGQHAATLNNRTTPLGTISTTTDFSASSPIGSLTGWDLDSLAATVMKDAVGHYFFDLGASEFDAFTFTATLTWNSLANVSLGTNPISNFDLALIDTLTQTIVWSSISTDENVEHIFLTDLAAGAYDLQVILRGGVGVPALTDTYAVAYSWVGEPNAAVPEGDATGMIILCGIAILLVQRRCARPRVSRRR